MVNVSSPDLDPELTLAQRSAESPDPAELARQARRLSTWARVVLVPVAIIGAVLSYQSLYKAAEPTFGPYLAAGFPLLVDLLILGASLQYVAGAKVGRPMTGWRLTAHCGVAATLFLNALASRHLGEVPWHVTAPAVWAVLVELTGKQVLGQWKAAHFGPSASIPPSLWFSAPIESFRTRLLMARTGVADAHRARIVLGTTAAAREALNLALPRRTNARRDAKRVRRVVNRQMRAGSLPPQAVLDAVGWTDPHQRSERSPETILRSVVHEILSPTETEVPSSGSVSRSAAGPDSERHVIVLPDEPVVARQPGAGEREPAAAFVPGARSGPTAPAPATSVPAASVAAPAAPVTSAPAASAPPAPVSAAPVPAASAPVTSVPAAAEPAPWSPAASAPAASMPAASVPGVSSPAASARVGAQPATEVFATATPATQQAPVQQGARLPAASSEVPVTAALPEPVSSRGTEVGTSSTGLWAAAQARTNGPEVSYPPQASPTSSVGSPNTEATAPLPQPVSPGADAVAPIHLLDSDEYADETYPDEARTRSSAQATQTGSILLSGRPTAKQKEERLDIAVRILNGNPDITGAELRAELEKSGWVVSDRTAARILGEAKQIPPLRAVRY